MISPQATTSATNRRFHACLVAMACLIAAGWAPGCAAYRFGVRSMYRTDIRTVHVPIVESDSYRRGLGERLTEALVRQVELNTPYKVVGSPEHADSILRCRLVSDQKGLTIETKTDESRVIEVGFVVEMDWVDRRGQSLVQRSEVPLPSSILSITQRSEFVPEVGQSLTTAHQKALEELARQIVAQMEAPW